MPRLALVRHGQSEWNLQNRFTGWWDADLTEKGEAEAKKSGEMLKACDADFRAAFTSVPAGMVTISDACREACDTCSQPQCLHCP